LPGTGSIDFDYIGRILLIMLVLYVLSSVFAYLMGWIMAGVSTDISYRFREEIAAKINKMPLSYFDRNTQGEVLSRITNDVDTVNQTLSQSLTQIITSAITVLGVLIMMFSISWLMTLVALIVIPPDVGGGGPHRQPLPGLLQGAAGLPGARQRPRGGNVWWAPGDEGVQHGRTQHREV
jgi:ATP-binding cassette subfamily B multidrug efflux pump